MCTLLQIYIIIVRINTQIVEKPLQQTRQAETRKSGKRESEMTNENGVSLFDNNNNTCQDKTARVRID